MMKGGDRESLQLLAGVESEIGKAKPSAQAAFYTFRAYGDMVQHRFEVCTN